jgi:glycosyltransferase involved in cell wall biosynthesis
MPGTDLLRLAPNPVDELMVIAPPWECVPPPGYGGIEEVLDALVRELCALLRKANTGWRVTLCCARGTTVEVFERHELTDRLMPIIDHRYNDVTLPIEDYVSAVMEAIYDRRPRFVLDSTGLIAMLNALAPATVSPAFPQVGHIAHGPVAAALATYRRIARRYPRSRVRLIGISKGQIRLALERNEQPRWDMIHNGLVPTDYAVGTGENPLVIMARVTRNKGHKRLIEWCVEHGVRLNVAGPVAGIHNAQEIEAEWRKIERGQASRYAGNPDFEYYGEIREHFFRPDGLIQYYGNVSGELKQELLNARAVVMPGDWPEPFGMVAIQAMAKGTPVVALARGALPEIVKHGVTGYLAESYEQLFEFLGDPAYLNRIDRAECRRHVERHFAMSRLVSECWLPLFNEAPVLEGITPVRRGRAAQSSVRMRVPAKASTPPGNVRPARSR